jgi:hypothetical protein
MAPRERKEELGTPFPPLAAGGKKLIAAPSNLGHAGELREPIPTIKTFTNHSSLVRMPLTDSISRTHWNLIA